MCAAILTACLSAGGGPACGVQRRPAAMPLDAIAPAELDGAGIRGTACVWTTADGRSIRFAAADYRAVVKLRGSLRSLRPAPGAADMFPFTHDGWSGDGIAIGIVKGRPLKQEKAETLADVAALTVRIGGRSSRHIGRLECGS